MQKHGKSYKILQFLIPGIGAHLRNLRIKWARPLFGRSLNRAVWNHRSL